MNETKTCLTCKHCVSALDFGDDNGCRMFPMSRNWNNRDGRCVGHTMSLWTWLCQRWLDRRPR